MPPTDYLDGARRDYDESIGWYARQSPAAAIRFADSIEDALSRIVATPTRFLSVDGVNRECPVKKFPFRIVYRLVDSRILVVAIAHAKRRPGYWRSRI